MKANKYSCFACSWAVSTVMTRQNFVPSSDGKTMLNALIPMWDMCNHSNGKVSIRIFSVYSEFHVIRLLLRSYRRLVHYNKSSVFGVYILCFCCVCVFFRLCFSWQAVLNMKIQGVFKKRPNICYEDFIAHYTAF